MSYLVCASLLLAFGYSLSRIEKVMTLIVVMLRQLVLFLSKHVCIMRASAANMCVQSQIIYPAWL